MTAMERATAGYRAYARYQGYAEKAHQLYGQAYRFADNRQTIWADICLACVRLSLSEAR